MKNFKDLISITIFLVLIGCNKPQDDIMPDNSVESNAEMVVEQERNPNYPVSSHKQIATTRVVEDNLELNECVGLGFAFENFPYEDMANLRQQVFDIERIVADYPNTYRSIMYYQTAKDICTFAGFQRFEAKVDNSQLIEGGVSANVFFMKASYKHMYKETFSLTESQSVLNVFGELKLNYFDRRYELVLSPALEKDLAAKYIDPVFLDNLYFAPIASTYNRYGGYVLSKFLSGGRATVLYNAQQKETSSSTVKDLESNLNAEIGASFANFGANLDLTVGREESEAISKTNDFSSISMSLRTYGGSIANNQFSPSVQINASQFDLSDWCESLKNRDLHVIAQLPPQSLIPISRFIEEDNLKVLLENLCKNGSSSPATSSMVTPYVQVKLSSDIARDNVQSMLVTRYGEHIVFKTITTPSRMGATYKAQEVERMRKMFPNIRIVSTPTSAPRIGPVGQVSVSELNKFDRTSMTKYVDSSTGKIYLMTTDTKEGKKIAYMLFGNDVVADYTFSQLLNNVRTTSQMSLSTIKANYYLIAL